MTLAHVAAYMLVSFGLTFMIQYATIFDGIRNWLRAGPDPDHPRSWRTKLWFELFDCAFCVGTWSGLIIGGVLVLVVPTSPLYAVLGVIASGLASATIGFFGYLITQKLL